MSEHRIQQGIRRPPNAHFTDGDNWGEADYRLSLNIVRQTLEFTEFFDCAEVRPHGRPSGLGTALGGIEERNFRALRVTDHQNVHGALDAPCREHVG